MVRIGMSKRGKVFGVGFCSTNIKGCIKSKHTKCYNTWVDMLERAYSSKWKSKNLTYTETTVCEEWHDFQAFSTWYNENYYELESGEQVQLDKDILVSGNKKYSPESCRFVPQSINTLLHSGISRRGEYPQGVSKLRDIGKYRARLKIYNKEVYIGTYATIDEAFSAYKEAKEIEIRRRVGVYLEVLPQDITEVLLDYKI